MGSTDNAPTLRAGSLGSRDIAFFVVAAAAPLTVMAAVAPIAILIGGIGAPAGYLAAGLISAVFAVGFMRMAPHVHNNGAFYSYVRKGLGRVPGLASALVAVVSYNLLQFSVYGLFGAVTAATAQDLLGVDLPWWTWALLGAVVVAVLGYRSVHVGARVLAVLLGLEVVILLVLAVAVIAQGGAVGLTLEPFAPEHVFTGSMGAVLAVAFAAFVGFEGTALYRSEAVHPERTIPRATYGAVGFLALFYCFIVWVALVAIGVDEVVPTAAADPAALFFVAMDTYVGSFATDVMRVLIVSSGLAALLAFHNAVTRYGYALARERVVPARLGAVHPRHHSPYVSSLAQTAVAVAAIAVFAIAGADPILELAAWTASSGTLGVVAMQLLTAASVAVFFARTRLAGWRSAAVSGGLGVVLLALAIYLVVDHIDLATLTTATTVNVVVVALPVVVFGLGAALGTWIRLARPTVYAGLGSTDIDGDLSTGDSIGAAEGSGRGASPSRTTSAP